MKPEKIVCAAIWFKTEDKATVQNILSGIVVTGLRHDDCYQTAWRIPSLVGKHQTKGDCLEGFLSSENRFFDRQAAAQIAFEANQTKTKLYKLTSLDLY